MFEGQYATDPNIATRAKYSDYMRGTPTASGYLTSPIFHAGLSKWDPTSDYQTKAEGIVGGDIRGANVLNTGIGTLTPEPYSPSSPNYNPRNWGHEFGHEASHAGWDYDTPYDQAAGEIGNFVTKIYDMSKGDYEGGEEEMLNRMHDYMYGDYKDPMIFGPTGFLRRQGYLNPNKINQMGFQTGWSDKGREAIKRSHVVDWQKGMLLQGPDSARGQIALGQRPDQVRAQGEAYMSPDRGNVQAPRMTSSQIRQEADRTGGTRHAGEMTQAAGRVRTQPVRGPHDYKKGGSVDPQEGSATGDLKDWFLNMKGRRPFGRTVRPEPHSKRGDWVDWFLNRRGLAGKFGGSERYKYDSYNPYDYQLFNGGGSVQSGPRTREKLEPRSIDSYRAERSDNVPDYFKKPYTPSDNIPDPYPLGIELLEKGKNIYNDYKPYIPKVRDDMLNWDLGNWNVGVGEEKFNLGYTLPLGGAGLRQTFRPLKKGLDSLNVTDPSDFYMDKIIRDNPEEVMYNLMRQYPSEEMQEYYDQPIDRYQLDFGGPEIDKWIGENPGSTIGDLYDYLPELRGTGSQPGDFWPGGAEI